MFLSLINKYLINDFYALNVHKDITDGFNLIHIRKNKDTVKIIEQDSTSDFDNVLQNLKKNIPVIISFTGNNIISKNVSNESNYLGKILFSQSPEDFYIQERTEDKRILISLIRKTEVDAILEKLSQNNIGVLDFNVGPYILENLKPLLPELKTVITKNLAYKFEDSSIEDSNSNDGISDFKIGEEHILNENIVAFASFIAHLNKGSETTNFNEITSSYQEEFAYRKAFSAIGIGTVVFFLLTLVISYLVMSIYSEKSAGIQQELAIKNEYLNQIQTLEKDKTYKENIINNSSLGSTQFLSFYLSKIIESVPDEIALTELNMFPAKEPINADDKISITPNKILIVGTTEDKHSVNDWVASLDELKWIKKTEIDSYTFIKNEYVFTLNLFL